MDKAIETILLKTTSIIHEYHNNTYRGSASCFFCEDENGEKYIITNKHVINGINRVEIVLTARDGRIENIPIILGNDVKVHHEYDLCAIPFSRAYSKVQEAGFPPYVVRIAMPGIIKDFVTFNRIQEIYMVGYPKAIYNEGINLPIIQRGITATSLCDGYNGKRMFLTDMPVIYGSSGSPIYIIDKDENPCLVGINYGTFVTEFSVYQSRMYHKKMIGKVKAPIPLGLAVRSDVLIDLLSNV